MELGFRMPDAFEFDGANTAQRWTKWRKQFETYHVAAELNKKAAEVQVAILLHAAGSEAQEIHSQFTFEAEADKNDYKKILDLFEAYCKPRKNTVYERYRFWSRDQLEDEPVDRWVKDLKTITASCEFGEQEPYMLRDKIVFGYRDQKVKERMLRESTLDLKKALEICRAAEMTKVQLKEMNNARGSTEDSSIHQVHSNRKSLNKGYNNKPIDGDESYKPNACFNCGGVGHFSRDCPNGDSFPRGKRKYRGRYRGRGGSRGAGRIINNHHLSRKVYEVEEDDEPDVEFQTLSLSTITVNAVNNSKGTITKRYVTFKFYSSKNRPAIEDKLKIDSGAEANLMPISCFRKLYPNRTGSDGLPLAKYPEKSGAVLTAYGGTVIEHMGLVNLPCQFKNKKFMCSFYLSRDDGPILLGLPSSEALGIVKITVDQVSGSEKYRNTKYVPTEMPLTERPPITQKEDLREMYPECFEYGPQNVFPNYEYRITVDTTVKPVIHPPKRVPLELRERVIEELNRMVKRGAIEKVEGPTDWVNSMSIQTKSDGTLRICLDPRDLNTAIKREHYASQTVQEKVHSLNGSDTFTKLDAKDGYWHVKLDDESSYLTTFNTPIGRYRFVVLPAGLNVSQDIFQMKIDEVYADCKGVLGVADDINVHGKGDAQHDLHLHTTMEQSRKSNIALNYDKITLKKPSIIFFGNMYSKDGVHPDPDKVSAIKSLRHPESKSELKTFLGMINYLQQFIPKLSEHTAPLRALEKRDVLFYWDENLQKCFESLKGMIADDITLAYYDRTKPVILQTDFSKHGIGATLIQDGRPVQYGSKALIGAEADYSPIEGEMLAILYGAQKWHHYLYGRKFSVESDHKPLMHIQKKNLSLAPPRIRGMLMMMSQYDYDIRHRPGKEMVLADALSRLSGADNMKVFDHELKVHSFVSITDERLKKLAEETENDEVLQKLLTVFHKGWPQSIKSLDKDLRPFWSIRDDISVLDGLVLCGSRIIIPLVSRKRVLNEIHEGHQGEVKCKLRAQSAVYWPGMYRQVEEMVKNCSTCQEHANAHPKAPMIPMDVPPTAWHTLGVDLFHFGGEWYLLMSDYFSKMTFVRYVGTTAAAPTIKAMKGIFSENGIPVEVVSDNGSHFTANEYLLFAKKWGFKMVHGSPKYPRGHGLIERHVQTVKKCMRKCKQSGNDVDLALLSLRTTPLDSHMGSPAEILNGRKYRSTIPAIQVVKSKCRDTTERLEERQRTAKQYYDRSVRPKDPLMINQNVRVYDQESRRWTPAMVVGFAKTPRSYNVQRKGDGTVIRRNLQHLKPTIEKRFETETYYDPIDDMGDVATDVQQPSSISEPDVPPSAPLRDSGVEAQTIPDQRGNMSRYPRRIRQQTDFYQAS